MDVCSFPQKRTFTLLRKRDLCKNNASEEAFWFSSEELNAQFKSLNSFISKAIYNYIICIAKKIILKKLKKPNK